MTSAAVSSISSKLGRLYPRRASPRRSVPSVLSLSEPDKRQITEFLIFRISEASQNCEGVLNASISTRTAGALQGLWVGRISKGMWCVKTLHLTGFARFWWRVSKTDREFQGALFSVCCKRHLFGWDVCDGGVFVKCLAGGDDVCGVSIIFSSFSVFQR